MAAATHSFETDSRARTLILLALAAALAAASLAQGRGGLTLMRMLAIWAGAADASAGEMLLMNFRLPRVLTGLFVGAALGLSGAVFQSVSRNPLGSPDLIGFTTGSATGALLQIVLYGPSATGAAAGAVAGGLSTALAVSLLARHQGRVQARRFVLVGIGVGAALHAINNLLLVKSDLDHAILANLWLAGSLNARTWVHAWLAMGAVLLFLPPLLLLNRRLRMLEMGDDLATQLGVPVPGTRLLALLCAVMLASLATAAAGPLGFIALAAPQLARRLLRAHGPCLVASAAMGAILVAGADWLAQYQPWRLNLPIGKLTGLLGGLYLVWLLTSRQR